MPSSAELIRYAPATLRRLNRPPRPPQPLANHQRHHKPPHHPNSPAQPLHAPHTLPQPFHIISRAYARMRARRVRARVLIARASILSYSIYPCTNIQPNASPCRPSLPTTTQHHASQTSTSRQHATTSANSRAGKVFPAPLCSGGNNRQNLHPRPIAHQRQTAASRARHSKNREKFGNLQENECKLAKMGRCRLLYRA